jgi:hypothetical protein
MDAFSSFLGRELTKRIEEQIAEYTKPLMEGTLTGYPEYQGRVGYLKGLRDALKFLDEIRLEDEENPLRRRMA